MVKDEHIKQILTKIVQEDLDCDKCEIKDICTFLEEENTINYIARTHKENCCIKNRLAYILSLVVPTNKGYIK